MKLATQSTQNRTLAQDQQQPQMCDALDVEAQSAPCEKPNLSSSCDAVVAPACTSSDDAACVTTSDLEDGAPFSIRGYAAAVREINISKCWPFSRQLLEESIQEGKHPLLPPISPRACEVKVIPEHYQDWTRDSAEEDMGANDGPHLQVQIDLSKCDAEIDSHDCATATCAPAKPSNPSLETTQLQELEKPCTPLPGEEAAKHGSLFGDCPLVFKRQAPRSIREIRNSVMQGCQCIKLMGAAQACKKDFCSKAPMLPPAADNKSSSLEVSDEHLHDGQLEGLNRKGFGDHENVSGITQLEPSREGPYENQGVAYLQAGSSPPPIGEMQRKVNYTNEQPVMLATSGPLTSQINLYENAALGKDIHVYTRGDITHRRYSVSDSQSVDKSHESHNLRSTQSRQCWDMTTQQELPDSIACLDNVLQQRCPICLLFQSSSNTALNVHIDRCLAASSMEEGTTKSKQKVRVRKKRSMAELCLIAPSSVVGGENTNERTNSDCNIKSQKPSNKAAVENKDKTTREQNELCETQSKINTFKLLQWGSRSSSRHGASRRGPIQEARTPNIKSQSFQSRTLEWRTSSVLRKTRKWKRQKTNHEPVAEQPKSAQPAPDQEKAQKLRQSIQRDKEVQNQNTRKDANQSENSASQSLIKKLSSKLHGRVLSKRKTAALRAVLQSSKKQFFKTSKDTSQVLHSDAQLKVKGSHEKSAEVVHTDNVVTAEVEKGEKTQEKVQRHDHVHPTKKRKNKRKQKTGAHLQEDLDLQLAIIRTPSVSQRVYNAECQSVGPDSPLEQHLMQGHLGVAEESLEPEMLRQPNPFRKDICCAGNSKRIAEEQSVQDPSLPLLSALMQNHQGERRKPPDCRKPQISLTHSNAPPCLTCTDHQSNTSGVLACFRGTNDIDASLVPLRAQPRTKMSLRKNSDAGHSRQKETDQIYVSDSQKAKISHFLSTMPRNKNSVSTQQFGRFPFSLSMTGTPWGPRQFEEQNPTTASSEGVHSSVPFHLIRSLEVAKRSFGTQSTSQGFGARQESLRHDTCMNHAGRQISALQKHAEARQNDPGSTQSFFHRDVDSTAEISPFPGTSMDNTWQAPNRSQRLPPWMEAAIHDQGSPAFSSMGLPTNSSCQSLLSNTPPSISPEMSRTLSVLEMMGSPVLRLMGKTVVLMPDASSGHVDISTGQLSSPSTHINFFQSLEPKEGTHKAQNQLDRSQGQNLQMQPGTQPEYLASDELTCRRDVQNWATSESRPIPQLQDFFCRTPSSSQIPSAQQPTSSPNITTNIPEQSQPMHSQLCSPMSYRAQLDWQHQKAAKTPLLWPQSSLCCPRNQGRTNLDFSNRGGECSSFRANPTLPQAPCNSIHNTNNINTGNYSNLSSWFASTGNIGVETSRQPAKVLILNEESPLCSINMSGPLGQGMATHPKQPEVSAAQPNGTPAECRENLPDLGRPARERPKDKTFIPIIYTMGGNSVAPPTIPAIVGPNTQKSVSTAHEQKQLKYHGASISHPRKRASCVEQPRDGAKHMKTSESMSPTPNVGSRVRHDKACSLGPSEPANCAADPTASMNALCAACDVQMQNMALSGSISASERRNESELLSLRPEQNAMQGQEGSNGTKEKRMDAPAVGMCSINMNPAEVDCHDAGQFTVTPTIDITSEPSPAYDAQACLDTSVSMCSHPHAPTQKAKWPLSSSSGSTTAPYVLPSSTSHPIQNAVIQSLHKKLASKLKSSLPIIYDSSRPPSFFVTIPMVNQPCSLLPEGMAQEFVSPANQPSLQASASNQDMHSFKAARKFVIVNGRVSIMDTQRNKSMVHQNVAQQGRRPVHTYAINGQRNENFIYSNQTDNGMRGRNQQYVADAMRQPADRGTTKVLGVGKSSARGSAGTTLEK